MEKTFRRRRAFAVEMRTFTGNKANYLAMTTGDGNFHIFTEVEAKQAAVNCGFKLDPRHHNPSVMLKERWRSAIQN